MVQLTVDHKPDLEGERQRIMSKGGLVGPTPERASLDSATPLNGERTNKRRVDTISYYHISYGFTDLLHVLIC